jgi:hypothetical protein
MLNGRLYRAAFVPFVFALAIAAFSLTGRAKPLHSALAPDAFEGQPTFAELRSLASEFPDRRPGSRGDRALAAHVAHELEALGGTAGGGFTVRMRHFTGQTIDGERQLTTIVAQRPGSTDAKPIVIVAHRDAAGTRGSQAELSATAALIELARVFAARETQRTIVLVSTSGGSGGDAGAAEFAASYPGPFDGAIVLGDLAGTRERKPFVVPYSNATGSAPAQLQRTVNDAITLETGSDPGAPSGVGQLAHLAFPLTVGEQGALNAAGIGAVLVQVSGERGPSSDRISAQRLELFGRAVLSAVDALDSGADLPSAMQTGLLVQRKTIPAWAVRLLAAALLLPPLIAAADGLARARRRRQAVGRWSLWTLLCAVPFLAAGLFAALLGALGIIGATPSAPLPPNALNFDGAAARAVVAVLLVFTLAWLLWPMLVRRLGLSVRPDSDGAGVAMLLVLLGVGVVVWALNPFAALLLLPAMHVWLLIVSPELRPRPPAALALLALGLLPLALLMAFYAHQLGLGPGRVAWMAVLLVAGGHLGAAAVLLWSLALGCTTATAMLALTAGSSTLGPRDDDMRGVTIRGPLSYAGPGSLGGTESALRR